MIPATFVPAYAPDPDRVYINYLRTCEMLGIRCRRGIGAWLISVTSDFLSVKPNIHTQWFTGA